MRNRVHTLQTRHDVFDEKKKKLYDGNAFSSVTCHTLERMMHLRETRGVDQR